MLRHFYKLIFVCSFTLSCSDDHSSVTPNRVKAIGACEAGHLITQCNNRSGCRMVCAVGGGAASAATGGSSVARAGTAAGTQICSELCSELPECSEVFVCDRYEIGGP
jgi:hypothetical protein